MKLWKINQQIYHRLNETYPDEYGDDEIEMMEDQSAKSIISVVDQYMSGWVPEKVVYPAKSYFVALVYARLLRDEFDEDPLEVLSDPDLLFGNDPYFQDYSKCNFIYDEIIKKYTWDFDLTKGEIPDVKKYFDEEIKLCKNE